MVMLGHRSPQGESQSFPPQEQFGNSFPNSQQSSPSASNVADMLAKNLTPDVEDDDIPF